MIKKEELLDLIRTALDALDELFYSSSTEKAEELYYNTRNKLEDFVEKDLK